jgi:hypothetical protein
MGRFNLKRFDVDAKDAGTKSGLPMVFLSELAKYEMFLLD